MVHNDTKTVGFTGCHSVSTHWVCVNLGICLYICIFVCACHTAVLRSPHDKKSFLSQLSSSCLLSLTSQHHLLSLHTHTHTHVHNQPIRGQKRVTFAYLVSRVTRKKLSSGASIQLGRLLRIITPPRVFPLLLLRPLCCKKNNIYI